MTNDRITTDQSPAARLSRLRDAALLEAEACEANGYSGLAQFAYGQANAYAAAITVITTPSKVPVTKANPVTDADAETNRLIHFITGGEYL